MTQILIPLSGGSANSDRLFSVQLGDNLVDFRQVYRALLGQWFLSGSIDGRVVFECATMTRGGDILAAWGIKESFGELHVIGQDPTLDNLGVGAKLVWLSL